MSIYLIRIENGRKVARPVATEGEYRALRNAPDNLANLELARKGDGEAKKRLVQFNYSGHFPNGRVKGNKLPSAAFGFDIDDKETFETVVPKLLADPESYGLLMLERSASQGGHAVFRRTKGRTILENQVEIAQRLRCEMDTSAHDINRVYFGTSASDEDLLYVNAALFTDIYNKEEVNAEANVLIDRERFSLEELPVGAHKSNKHYHPWVEESNQINVNAEQKVESGETPSDASLNETEEELSYKGIPYSAIIAKWWDLYYDGDTPVVSNRDSLTFELAVNLRHICGFDRVLMDKVIPCYDGFPHDQKMKCIDSALGERRTQMPSRLKNALSALRADYYDNAAIIKAFDQTDRDNDLFYSHQMPKGALPMGVSDSVKSAGLSLMMAVINTVTAAVGFIASGIRVVTEKKPRDLVLMTFNVGDAGSGKSNLDPIFDTWTAEAQAQDAIYLEQEKKYRNRKNKAKNAKEQPDEPELPVRVITVNNTLANVTQRLANADGYSTISYSPEADALTAKWKNDMMDLSVLMRQSYDATKYDREARSAEAVNVHIKKLRWSLILNGTKDALYRLVTNYTDGFLSRLAIQSLPDNTFAPLDDDPPVMSPKAEERIGQVAHILAKMQGDINLPKLEAKSMEWVERIRIEAMKNNDEPLAKMRMRGRINALRMTACLMLCLVAERLIKQHGVKGAEDELKKNPEIVQEMMLRAQTPDMLRAFEVIADSLIDNDMLYFRSRIEAALHKDENSAQSALGRRKGDNDSIYALLPSVFTSAEAVVKALQVKPNMSDNAVQQMLKNWKKQGLVKFNSDEKTYTKLMA